MLRNVVSLILGMVWMLHRSGYGAETIVPGSGDLSLQLEIERAFDRGAAALVDLQHTEGFWSTVDHPAVTALALTALSMDPSERATERFAENLRKGYEWVVASAQEDGGIYRVKTMQNYNTALSIMALVVADEPEYHALIRKARRHLVGWQSDFEEPGVLDTPLDGGVGYGGSYPHSDLSNTHLALEAMVASRFVEGETPLVVGENELNWEAALHFVQNCQNLPEVNQQGWASNDPTNRGGFVYFPGNTKSEEMTLAGGRVALRSYGSISYAGLLSFIYADLDASDSRVIAALDWLERNYTLEENPGMDAQGLYYYYHTMAKALSARGRSQLETPEGTVDWRRELALELINRQREDGSWINDTARWWENDRALVTGYALKALALVHRTLEP